MIKVIVDSTCDLPEEIIDEYEMDILPLRVLLGEKEFLDKKTIQVDEVYAAMRKGIIPKTSQPYPQDIYNLFQKYCSKGIDFIYLSFSSVLSGTYQLAKTIMQDVKHKYPQRKMAIVDTKAGALASGLIALRSLNLIEKKQLSFDNIVKHTEHLTKYIEHIFTISDLNWLIKGGRINKTQGIIGNILDVKPILHVKEGAIQVYKKTRGEKKALKSIVDILEERSGNLRNQIIGVSHADDAEKAQELADMIKTRLGFQDFIVNKIGSVLGSHLGISGVGIFFFNKNMLTDEDVPQLCQG